VSDFTFVPSDDAPNEVGYMLFDGATNAKGLVIVSSDLEAPPYEVVEIPAAFRDDYEFTVTVSPHLAHYLGAVQFDTAHGDVAPEVVLAGRIIWWMLVDATRMRWKEVRDG